jgi:hypothetical protein
MKKLFKIETQYKNKNFEIMEIDFKKKVARLLDGKKKGGYIWVALSDLVIIVSIDINNNYLKIGKFTVDDIIVDYGYLRTWINPKNQCDIQKQEKRMVEAKHAKLMNKQMEVVESETDNIIIKKISCPVCMATSEYEIPEHKDSKRYCRNCGRDFYIEPISKIVSMSFTFEGKPA